MEQIGLIGDFIAGIILGTILLVIYLTFVMVSVFLELGNGLFNFMRRKNPWE